MAKYNEILAGRYNALLTRLFSMKGPAPAPQLGGEISPNFPLFSGEENRFLEQWHLFGNGSQATAVAAQNSAWRFRNPAGSNVIAVIYQLGFTISVADPQVALTLDATATDLAGPGAVHNLDFRSIGTASAMSISTGNNDVAAHPVVSRFGQLITTPWFFVSAGTEVPCTPGSTYEIVTSVANVTLTISCFWRERFLEESERR